MSCPFCDKQYVLQEAHRSREVKPGIVEHGLFCPNCKKLVHNYYDSHELSSQREKISVLTQLLRKSPTIGNRSKRRDAIEAYRRQFERFQERVLKKFNLPTDGSIIVWDYNKEEESE